MDPAPERPRRGVTLLEAVLAAFLPLGAGTFAAWRATAPKRLLRTLQSGLCSSTVSERYDAAEKIFAHFVRDGMTEAEVRALFAPRTMRPIREWHRPEETKLYLDLHRPVPGSDPRWCSFFFYEKRLVKQNSGVQRWED